MKREVESLKSEVGALPTGHLTATEGKMPWTPEKWRRHEVNGHAEYDNRCEVRVKTRGISRHPRRVYSDSCGFDCASVTFKGRVSQSRQSTSQRTFLLSCTTRRTTTEGAGDFLVCHESEYPSIQVISDKEEPCDMCVVISV